MNNTTESMTYLRGQASSGSIAWQGLCLKLQRVARGLPAVYPSALSAQQATPQDNRYASLPNIRRGMICYFDDPNDSNPYGHITGVAGRANDGELLHWSNDAAGPGRVSLVRHSFFERYWGDSFQFASDWLNGYELDLPDKKTKPAPPLESTGDRIRHAIDDLQKARAYHQKKSHTKLAKALERDIAHLREVLKEFS